ncbi:TPA: autotransporter outer membrane beta-barrel domain-containing protein [Stenotrophomonas maltophilia]|nr:autotransporter outer membrane beta-barrel domain-containing protein [Stenotrophomonas maltophilia]
MKTRSLGHPLAIAIAVGMCTTLPVQARDLGPGESHTVLPGDTVETWNLNDASLIMRPGSVAERVSGTNGSIIDIEGATVGHPSLAGAVGLRTGTIARIAGTEIVSSSVGVETEGDVRLDVSDSTITTGERGVTVFSGGVATLRNTSITAQAPHGVALVSANPGATMINEISVTDGSRAVGAEHAALLNWSNSFRIGGHSLIVDDSHLESLTGAAVLVSAWGMAANRSASIQLRNGTTVNSGNGVLLETRSGTIADLLIDNSTINGDLLNGVGSTIDARLQNGASLTGAMTNVSSLALDAATWNITGDSTLGRLDLGTGTVAFAAPTGGVHKTLDVAGDFSGNGGTILFNTVLADDAAASDRLVIGGDTSGTANVRVNNVGGAGAQTVNGIELINVGGASNGVFTLQGRAIGGQYEYFLHKGRGTDGNWYLRSELPFNMPDVPVRLPESPVGPDYPHPIPGPDDPYRLPGPQPEDEDAFPLPGPDPDGANPEPVLRPEGGAYLANLQAAQSMFQMGYQQRQAGLNGGRSWVSVDGSRQGFDAVSRQLDIHGNSQSLTVGSDVWHSDNGLSAGVMLASGNATSTSTSVLTGYYARGKVKGEALGVYGTWRGGNAADPSAGFYVDATVQRAQFRNRVEGVGLEAERYRSRAWQGTLEAGHTFRIGGASNGGVYLQPELQVGYNRWSDTRHTEVNGTEVTIEDANGLFGRAGVRLSGVTQWNKVGAELQPYVAAHWLHNRANLQVGMDGDAVDARIPRSRAEVSVGASLKFAGGVGVFGGLSLQHASGYHRTAAQLGVNYSW